MLYEIKGVWPLCACAGEVIHSDGFVCVCVCVLLLYRCNAGANNMQIIVSINIGL